MLIQHRFDYKPIARVDHPSGRRYLVSPEKSLPSVTSILAATKDMTYLNEWRAAMGDAEATRITTEASNIGSDMHNLLEKHILGQDVKGAFMPMTLAKLIIKKGLSKVDEVWGTEVALYMKDLYAGTTDLVGVHAGTPAIMDFKNSRQEKTKEMIEDYFLQLAAYAMAHNEMYGTDIRKGVIMMATRTGKYLEFIIEGDEFVKYETMWANKVCAYYDQSE